MQIKRLQIRNMRCFAEADVILGPGINLISGKNGAGKTTLLEAVHLMAYSRSFRGKVRDGLIRQGEDALDIYVEWTESISLDASPILRRAGLHHNGQKWKGRLDGEDVYQIGTLCAALAVVTFEPGTHALISGGGESRRRFLDWGLFHVEPGFYSLWRRYARALKQRNALLKQGHHSQTLDSWDQEMADAGEMLTTRRMAYVERLQAQAIGIASKIAPNLQLSNLDFTPGWRRHELSLLDALFLTRERDQQYGYTSIGPHRADWSPNYTSIPGREALSRGQAKLTAMSCLLAQAEDFAERRNEWPVIALDDIGAELDSEHFSRVFERLATLPAQVLITATTPIPECINPHKPPRRFHVEHGAVRCAT